MLRAKYVLSYKDNYFFAFLCILEYIESIETHLFFSKKFVSVDVELRARCVSGRRGKKVFFSFLCALEHFVLNENTFLFNFCEPIALKRALTK